MIEDDLFCLFIDLLLLPENDITFPLDSRRLELRVLQNVADDVHGGGHILAEALGIVHRLLAGGVRVEMRSEVLNLELERMLTPSTRSLERHMLQKVGRPVRCVRLGPRACVYPNTNGSGLHMRLRLRCDGQPIRERRNFGDWTRNVDGCCERPQRSLGLWLAPKRKNTISNLHT